MTLFRDSIFVLFIAGFSLVCFGDTNNSLDPLKIELEKNAKEIESIALQLEKASGLESQAFLEAQKSLFEQYAVLLQQSLEQKKENEKQLQNLREQEELIQKIRNKAKNRSNELSMNDYIQINVVWRSIVDKALGSLFQRPKLNIQFVTAYADIEETSEENKETWQKLNAHVYIEKSKIEEVIRNSYQQARDKGAKVLLAAGRVRSDLMRELSSKSEFSVWALDDNLVDDFVREVKIVPYRFLAGFEEQYFKFVNLSQKGLRGWIEILWQIFLFGLVLCIPFILLRFFRYVSVRLDQFRKNIFTKSTWSYQKRTKVALWIGRLNPYIPWVFAYLGLRVAQELLEGTLLDALSIFFPYLIIYVFYRLFNIAFRSVLGRLLLAQSLTNLNSKQLEVKALASKLGILFFTEWAILHATEDMVRRALIYNLVSDVVLYFNLFVIALESRQWKTELLVIAKQWMPTKLFKKIESSNSRILDWIWCPLVFLGNFFQICLQVFYQWISQFEMGKQLSSELFKRRLEDASTDSDSVDGLANDINYRSLFERKKTFDPKLYVSLSRSHLDRCESIISQWKEGKTFEDLILLYGNIGIGKSTLLNSIENKFSKNTKIVNLGFDNRITSRDQLYEKLSDAFGMDFNCATALEEWDKTAEKTLVLFDDIHCMYLNTINGLEAYRAFVELTSLQLENVFWVLTSNERALAHLNGLFGTNHFFGTKIELSSWTDSEIQSLIMRRHQQTKYKLRFDQVISAVHRGDVLENSTGIEVQFFRLLWGQSRGNPSTALELWLSACHRLRGNTIRISVPDFTSSKALASLGDEALMCYASLVKHEALSFSEICETTRIPFNIIRQSLKYGEDNQILQITEGRKWRIHPKSQYIVYSQLSGRNLVYG